MSDESFTVNDIVYKPIPGLPRHGISRDGRLWSRSHGELDTSRRLTGTPHFNLTVNGKTERLNLVGMVETVWGADADWSWLPEIEVISHA